MFPSDNFNRLLKDIVSRLNKDTTSNASCSNGNNNSDNGSKISITPSKALVIAGLISGVLDVESVLVDRDQTVSIVISGSLKQKTDLEKMLDQIGSLPFDEVMKALFEKFS